MLQISNLCENPLLFWARPLMTLFFLSPAPVTSRLAAALSSPSAQKEQLANSSSLFQGSIFYILPPPLPGEGGMPAKALGGGGGGEWLCQRKTWGVKIR